MKEYFADLHIHVGLSSHGTWIKIPTSRNLTVRNILFEAEQHKGIELVGLVDAMSPLVLKDIDCLINSGELSLLGGGGYRFHDKMTVILGAEIETTEDTGGSSHTLVYLPDCTTMRRFSHYMAKHIKNINLSSQNAKMPLKRLIRIAANFAGIIIPAHIFTPYKSLYGVCCTRLNEILSDEEIELIDAVELGLSADSQLADRIGELSNFAFVTNSDAHSLAKIAREYTVLQLESPSFAEYRKALHNTAKRGVVANYGLDPRLGKYHRTFCSSCLNIVNYNNNKCPICDNKKIVNGVFDRINAIADFAMPHHPKNRPPYYYQIPLEFIPGIGPKTIERLLSVFGTEMNVVHKAEWSKLVEIIGEPLAKIIIKGRQGKTTISVGGGGLYGKVIKA